MVSVFGSDGSDGRWSVVVTKLQGSGASNVYLMQLAGSGGRYWGMIIVVSDGGCSSVGDWCC